MDSKGRGRHDYQFAHQKLPRPFSTDSLGSTVIFYRVRQLFREGHFTLSKTIPVRFDENSYLYIYPNPVANDLTIRSAIETEAVVYDVTGKISVLDIDGMA